MSNSSDKDTLSVKLTIKTKNIEIVSEGSLKTLSKELSNLAEFAKKASEKIDFEDDKSLSKNDVEVPIDETGKLPITEIPNIQTTGSTISNLNVLFDTQWGHVPRALTDIMKALEINAANDRVQAVQTYLTRLVKRNKLNRIQKEGKYFYFRRGTQT